MLSNKGFDLWADGYDRSVGLSDESNTYPFAGYRAVLNAIYNDVLARGGDVLDVGFGTGTLAARLCQQGLHIFGQDFSPRMIELAQPKMPGAQLFCGDFTKGLVPGLTARRYDSIVATYSLHHLTDAEKPAFLQMLLGLLKPGGRICIGDVAFPDRAALEACRQAAGEEWDDDEHYFAVAELAAQLPCRVGFESFSFCAGVLFLDSE